MDEVKPNDPNQTYELPHPDYSWFSYVLTLIMIGGTLVLCPPSLWFTVPPARPYLLAVWILILFITLFQLIRVHTRIQLGPTQIMNVNSLTKKSKSIHFDEIQSYAILPVHKSNSHILQVKTRSGETKKLIYHSTYNDLFISAMDQRRSSGVYREI